MPNLLGGVPRVRLLGQPIQPRFPHSRRSRPLLVTLAAVTTAIASLCGPLTADAASRAMPETTVEQRLANPNPLVISHRGCWRQPAENSLEGLRNCAKLGVDFVEIDLRKTSDGAIVLLHDETLDRTTSLRGRLEDVPLSQVRRAYLRRGQGGPGEPLTRQRLPTFEEVLTTPLGNTFIFLDIKEPIHDDVFRLVQKHHAEGRVLFSINTDFGSQLTQSDFVGHAALMLKFNQYRNDVCQHDADPAADLANYGLPKAGLREAVFCDDHYLARVRELPGGGRIWVNVLGPPFAGGREDSQAVLDPDGVWGDLLNRGVSAIQTDHPAELIAYLRKTGRR